MTTSSKCNPNPLTLTQQRNPGLTKADSHLSLVSIDGVSSDTNSVGGPSSVNGDWQPADDSNPRRGTVLQLDIQRSIGRTCRKSRYDISQSTAHNQQKKEKKRLPVLEFYSFTSI